MLYSSTGPLAYRLNRLFKLFIILPYTTPFQSLFSPPPPQANLSAKGSTVRSRPFQFSCSKSLPRTPFEELVLPVEAPGLAYISRKFLVFIEW